MINYHIQKIKPSKNDKLFKKYNLQEKSHWREKDFFILENNKHLKTF